MPHKSATNVIDDNLSCITVEPTNTTDIQIKIKPKYFKQESKLEKMLLENHVSGDHILFISNHLGTII